MSKTISPDKPKILVVNDYPELLDIIRRILEAANYKVLCAATPTEALTLARLERPDILLFDLILPGMDGVELLCQVRDQARLEQAPIIIMTPLGSASGHFPVLKIHDLPKDAVDAYLFKPFGRLELLRAVKKALRRQPGISSLVQA